MKIAKILLIVLVFAAFGTLPFYSLPAYGAEEGSLFVRKEFDFEELRKTPILDVVGDQRGITYFAQGNRILEFDGVSWRTISAGDSTTVTSFGLGTDGRVYVGGMGDMGSLTPDLDGNLNFSSYKSKVPQKWQGCLSGIQLTRAFEHSVAYICNGNGNVSGALVLDQKADTLEFYPASMQFTAATTWRDGLYLVDSAQGLVQFKDKKIVSIPGGEVIRAKSIAPLDQDRLLINSVGNGILVLKMNKDNKITWETFGNGSTDFRDRNVTRALPVAGGYVIGTFLEGLYFFDEKKGVIAHAHPKEDLPGNDIDSLYIDREGGAWVGTESGLAYVRWNRPGAAVYKPLIPFSAIIREITSTKDAFKVFGGAFVHEKGGAQKILPSKLNFRELKFSQNALRFSFSSNSLGEASQIEYRTVLEGYEKNWSDWSPRNFREFTNLVWNSYNFKVQARKKDGTLSDISYYEYRINPPWYETTWFYALQFAILLALYCAAAYARGTGRPDSITKKVNGIFMSILFGTIYSKIGIQAFLGTMANGIGFVKLLSSAILGLFLKPMEGILEKYLCKFTIGSPKPTEPEERGNQTEHPPAA